MRHSNKQQIILASQSPRRKYLLEQAGIIFTVKPADVEEEIRSSESPEAYVKRLSREKAEAIAACDTSAWIIGADTIVVVDDQILEKPENRYQARQMLGKLSNREHCVFTGVTICCKNAGKNISFTVKTNVTFKELSNPEIEWYVSTDEPFDKAGAYAIQGLGTFLVKSIQGSYTNVVGLPVCEVIEILIKENVIEII